MTRLLGPPRLALLLLRIALPAEDRAAVVGELEELFFDRLRSVGRFRATLWLWRHGIGFALGLGLERFRSRAPSALGKEVRYALRRLRRAPGFSFVVVLTLAIGIGGCTIVFTLLEGVLLAPLSYPNSEELVELRNLAPGWDLTLSQSSGSYFLYKTESRSFQDVALQDLQGVSVIGEGEPERLLALMVDDSFLPLMRAAPHVGRLITADDNRPGAPETVLLSHGYWVRRFGADPQVLGRTMVVDGRSREIIGVLHEDFHYWDRQNDPAIYFPAQLDPAVARTGGFQYGAVARLVSGLSPEDAEADLVRLIPKLPELYPGGPSLNQLEDAGFAPDVRFLKEAVVGDVGNVLWVLAGAVGIVLLIVCANVANLFLVRVEGRQGEVAVRSAMGASREQIVWSFLVESALLGLIGGLGGLLVALGGLRLLVVVKPASLPRLSEIAVGPSAMLFTLVISFLAGLLFGVLPTLRYVWADVLLALKTGGRGVTGDRTSHRARRTLVGAQLAFAVVLLVASGLMARTFAALRSVDPGFSEPSEILTVRLGLSETTYPEDWQLAAMHEQIARKIEAIPGVVTVGVSSGVTMDGSFTFDPVWVEDHPTEPGQLPSTIRWKWVAGDYFQAMGNPVIAGRALDWSDSQGRVRAAVVTEGFALTYWDDSGVAIGKRVRQVPEEEWWEIVGVVGDVHDDGVDQGPVDVVYRPMAWTDGEGRVLAHPAMVHVIRTDRPIAAGLMPDLRRAIWSVDPDVPLTQLRTMDEILSESMTRTSFALLMLAVAATIALLLGAVGLYGVVSYVVSRQTRDIGVRVAMGADATRVTRMVLADGSKTVVVGIGVGLIAALALTRMMSALLYGVEAVDPRTYSFVCVGLTVVSLLAMYVPARRAAKLDPVEALRS